MSGGPSYDANGNQLSSTGLSSISWNAYGQAVSVSAIANEPYTGTYDAAGRLVEITLPSGGTQQFVYSPSGAKIAVVNNGTLIKGTVSLPGGDTAIYNFSGLSYLRHTDWLGSSRLATTWNHGVYSKESYAPFGETYNEGGTPDRSFTGQDQDVVTGSQATGIYEFMFRKYDPAAGRWLSPDPMGWGSASLENPQSLNRYAYAMNSPLSNVDPNGLDCVTATESGGIIYNQGDCPGNDPNNEYYIDCDGCINTAWGAQLTGSQLGLLQQDGTYYLIGGFEYTDTNGPSYFAGGQDAIYTYSVSPGAGTGGSAPSNGTIKPMSRLDCASYRADKELSIASMTSGSSPDNPVVQAFLGNSFSGVVNLFTTSENPLTNLVTGGWNPGVPGIPAPEVGGYALDGGLAGAATKAALGGATDLFALPKLAYDAATFLGAAAFLCR